MVGFRGCVNEAISWAPIDKHRIGHLPAVDDGGVVSICGVATAGTGELEREADYIAGRSRPVVGPELQGVANTTTGSPEAALPRSSVQPSDR